MNFKVLTCCLALAALVGCAEREPAVETTPGSNAATPSSAAAETIVNSIGMKLALIPAGEFLMGSPDSAPDAAEDEKPQHRVRITEPFYLGVYEVTQEQYRRIMGAGASFYSPTGAGKDKVAGLDTRRFPAEQVRWYDAAEFCRRLSALAEETQANHVYRLPTEAEWEYACRAGTTTTFHFGDAISSDQANFNGEYPYGGGAQGAFLARTAEVGSYKPNAFGLYDMHGNVEEWCNDWYGRDYYGNSPVDDPMGPESGLHRVIRGGEWYSDARDCRSAFRYADIPGGTFYVMGFRVAMQIGGRPQVVDAPELGRGVLPPGATVADTTPVRAADPALLAAGEDWPRWRGPRGDGTWTGPELPEKWPEAGLGRVWRQEIGGGYGGVAVAGGRVYVMDREGPSAQDAQQEDRREFERVLCFDALTGRPLWSHAYPVDYKDVQYGNGPRATPTVVQRHVYTLGATGALHCLDAVDGSVVWHKDLLRDYGARIPVWGLSASPVVFEDLVIVHPGGEPDACLIAFNRLTGDEVWRNLPDEAGYATPIVIESHGRTQLVAWTPSNLCGLDPRTGELFWSIPFVVTYGTSIATPIFQDNIVLVSNYYEGAKAIELGSEPTDAKVLWEDRRNLRGLMCQPLCRDGHAYLLDKRFGLTCFELRSGKKLWDDAGRMTPKGRNPQATMVRLGETDRALVLNSEGDLILARFTPAAYEELSRTNIISPTWAHPAYAGGYAFARNDTELVCVQMVESAQKQ
jgi:outer membrane protein assembly factor BamB